MCKFDSHTDIAVLGTATSGPQLVVCSIGHPCLHSVSSVLNSVLRLRNQNCIKYLKCRYVVGVYIDKILSCVFFVPVLMHSP